MYKREQNSPRLDRVILKNRRRKINVHDSVSLDSNSVDYSCLPVKYRILNTFSFMLELITVESIKTAHKFHLEIKFI